jgi:septal ring factor EnvC (AmiA/AmiB activator)
MKRALALFAAVALGSAAMAQTITLPDDPAQTRRDLAEAQAQANQARSRAERLESSASQAIAAADKTAQETAAVAARIQQAEAQIAATQAQIRIIDRQRADLRARLAARQKPLVELTAALQRLSRRPPVVSLLRPGTVQDTVHSRALLETMLPQVQKRTAALRSEMARARALQDQARAAAQQLKGEIANLDTRRRALAQLETNQRLAARDANGHADREAERALALAEKARDLGGLVANLEEAATLRDRLARLPGPVIRPSQPSLGATTTPEATAAPSPLPDFLLPVAGRLVSGFGDASRGSPSRGIAIEARAGAQIIAPAAGRVAFADSYSGYGQIAIIDHAGGWTSLVTGLDRLSVRVGDRLVAGSPLGTAGAGKPVLTLELRKDGKPVNPLDQLKAR